MEPCSVITRLEVDFVLPMSQEEEEEEQQQPPPKSIRRGSARMWKFAT